MYVAGLNSGPQWFIPNSVRPAGRASAIPSLGFVLKAPWARLQQQQTPHGGTEVRPSNRRPMRWLGSLGSVRRALAPSPALYLCELHRIQVLRRACACVSNPGCGPSTDSPCRGRHHVSLSGTAQHGDCRECKSLIPAGYPPDIIRLPLEDIL